MVSATNVSSEGETMRTGTMTLAAVAALLAAGLGLVISQSAAEEAVVLPPPALDTAADMPAASEVAVLAGGCFWGVQGVFQHVEGVRNAVSGYAGGEAGDAHYDVVSMGTTGHAEAVQVTFDPRVISYGEILHIFFSVAHDPTQLDRQGPDSGPQYRSAIFAQSPEQAEIAEAYIAQLDETGAFDEPIVTRMEQGEFYPAEGYHQDFMAINPTYPYIVYFDLPKIDALRRLFPEVTRAEPVLVSEAGS
jgi:peptide-methionine (S)-S-oxide reductase